MKKKNYYYYYYYFWNNFTKKCQVPKKETKHKKAHQAAIGFLVETQPNPTVLGKRGERGAREQEIPGRTDILSLSCSLLACLPASQCEHVVVGFFLVCFISCRFPMYNIALHSP